jgi:hypothetical protein
MARFCDEQAKVLGDCGFEEEGGRIWMGEEGKRREG